MELNVEDCLLMRDATALVSVLRHEGLSHSIVCRVDKLVTKELKTAEFSSASMLLKAIGKISEKSEDLELLLKHGLGPKVVYWFEVVRDLLTSDLYSSSVPLLSLTEEFYDYYLLLGQAAVLVPIFLLSTVLMQLAGLVIEPGVNFGLRLEAIRTYNSILEALSKENRRLLQTDPQQCQIARSYCDNNNPCFSSLPSNQLATAILTVGDYELQVSLSEALCRLTPKKDRQQRANHWFANHDITNGFCSIRDGDFEVDCRKFLNYINCRKGDQRKVYSIPCLRAFLDTTELLPPKDDKLDQFWIDFNVASECISFFIDDPQCFLWGSIHLLQQDIDHYSLCCKQNECNAEEAILTVQLSNPVIHHKTKGQRVEMFFSPEQYKLLVDATGKVFKKTISLPCGEEGGGSAWTVLPAETEDRTAYIVAPAENSEHAKQTTTPVSGGCRSYIRKKPHVKSSLKVLPMSSPSSEEESPFAKTPRRETSEILFDHIIHSTPKQTTADSGIGGTLDFLDSTEEPEEIIAPVSVNQVSVLKPVRKRQSVSTESSQGSSPQKRNVKPLLEVESPNQTLKDSLAQMGVASEAQFGAGIIVAFKAFSTQLRQHFTVSWQKVESDIFDLFNDSQQDISNLLRAVHQHRLLLLQRFEETVVHQLNHVEETCNELAEMQSTIMGYLRTEVQSLGSFCNEQQLRLAALQEGEKING